MVLMVRALGVMLVLMIVLVLQVSNAVVTRFETRMDSKRQSTLETFHVGYTSS